jgi:hypothetical protein
MSSIEALTKAFKKLEVDGRDRRSTNVVAFTKQLSMREEEGRRDAKGARRYRNCRWMPAAPGINAKYM